MLFSNSSKVFDNALAAAGLLDDPRVMVPRLNELLLSAIQKQQMQ
jgi:hypothetical protein